MPKEVEQVLRAAAELKKNKKADWYDYEALKRDLQSQGYFGYEGALADALGL